MTTVTLDTIVKGLVTRQFGSKYAEVGVEIVKGCLLLAEEKFQDKSKDKKKRAAPAKKKEVTKRVKAKSYTLS